MFIRMIRPVFETIFTLRFWKWFYAFLPIWIIVMSQFWTIQIWGRVGTNNLQLTSDQTGAMLPTGFGCALYPESFGIHFQRRLGVRLQKRDRAERDLLAELMWKGDWEFIGVVKQGHLFASKAVLGTGGRIGVRHSLTFIAWSIAITSVEWLIRSRRKRAETLDLKEH